MDVYPPDPDEEKSNQLKHRLERRRSKVKKARAKSKN